MIYTLHACLSLFLYSFLYFLFYHFSWLLHLSLSSVGFNIPTDLSCTLHMNFASELESIGMWHWAIFVYLHHPNAEWYVVVSWLKHLVVFTISSIFYIIYFKFYMLKLFLSVLQENEERQRRIASACFFRFEWWKWRKGKVPQRTAAGTREMDIWSQSNPLCFCSKLIEQCLFLNFIKNFIYLLIYLFCIQFKFCFIFLVFLYKQLNLFLIYSWDLY